MSITGAGIQVTFDKGMPTRMIRIPAHECKIGPIEDLYGGTRITQGCLICHKSEEAIKRDEQQRKEIHEINEMLSKLSVKELQAYEFLNNLMDQLYKTGVDTSYFPYEAKKKLIEQARLLTILITT